MLFPIFEVAYDDDGPNIDEAECGDGRNHDEYAFRHDIVQDYGK